MMKRPFFIFFISLGLGFLLVSLVAYARQTTMTNYYPSPSGNYTKVHLVSSAVDCTTVTNAGKIFTDSTGALQVCKSDGSTASYPGACFTRFGTAVASPPCPTNYYYKPSTSGSAFTGIVTWYCCFNNNTSGQSIANTAKAGCFSVYTNGPNSGGAWPAPAASLCSNVDSNAYDIGCDTIDSSDMGVPVFKRNCCYNVTSLGPPGGTTYISGSTTTYNTSGTSQCSDAAKCINVGVGTSCGPGSECTASYQCVKDCVGGDQGTCTINAGTYISGSTAPCICDSGYNPGSVTDTCNAGSWSGVCPKQCPGSYSGNNCTISSITNSGANAACVCNAGYHGTATYSCNNGNYTQVSNTCTANVCGSLLTGEASCGSPVLPANNGQAYLVVGNNAGSCTGGACTAYCSSSPSPGYIDIGGACQANCTGANEGSCTISGTYNSTSTATCTCNSGYNPGTQTWTCNNGGWSGVACPMQCTGANEGRCTISGTYNSGSTAACICNSGYCAGSTTYTCNNGSWSGSGNACIPKNTCASLGDNCGFPPDGCGGTLASCGACQPGNPYPTSYCNNYQCLCSPFTCSSQGLCSGSSPYYNGCGGTMYCSPPLTCGYYGFAIWYGQPGGEDYSFDNGCGGELSCCVSPFSCDGNYNCGSFTDSCGVLEQCGTCSSGQSCNVTYQNAGTCVCSGITCGGVCCPHNSNEHCSGGGTSGSCVCTPLPCVAYTNAGLCGTFVDGCGGLISCGCNPPPEECDQEEGPQTCSPCASVACVGGQCVTNYFPFETSCSINYSCDGAGNCNEPTG